MIQWTDPLCAPRQLGQRYRTGVQPANCTPNLCPSERHFASAVHGCTPSCGNGYACSKEARRNGLVLSFPRLGHRSSEDEAGEAHGRQPVGCCMIIKPLTHRERLDFLIKGASEHVCSSLRAEWSPDGQPCSSAPTLIC